MITKETEKKSAPAILEGMTSISALLGSTCNNRRIEKILIDAAKRRSKAPEIGFLTAKSHELGFPIEFVTAEKINAFGTGNTHGGIVALCTDRHLPSVREASLAENGFYVYLDGIEDPYNFGYTLRSLYAAGVTGAVLPPRNWLSAAGVVARASAGASEAMPLYVAEAEEAIAAFHNAGYQILCAGIRDSVSIFDEDFSYPILLVVGGEKRGISRKILEKADKIVRIDYGRSFRGSLSAASAATVMAFEIFRKNRA